ncbi:MAG: hypothetical protein ACE5MB_05300 [Anaerolineae bacterium]
MAVIVGALLAAAVIWITLLSTTLMMGTAVLLVLVISLGIFAARGNFGEAMLSTAQGDRPAQAPHRD